MGPPGIRYISAYFALVFIVIFHGLSVLWPPNRDSNEIGESIQKVKELDAALRQLKDNLAQKRSGDARNPPANTTAPPGETLTTNLGTDLGADLGTDLETGFEPDLGTELGTSDLTTSRESDQETKDQLENSGERKGKSECNPPQEGQELAKFFWVPLCLSPEERLLMIVMFAGALGGLVHALRSFYWYLGNRTLVTSWAGMYVSLPLTGAAMGVLFYLLVRGGFFSPQSKISDTSPFGFAALAALVGMFTEQAALKLRQIAETVFSPSEKGKDDATAPKLGTITPAKGKAGEMVKISGSNFVEKSRVTFGGQAATTVTFKSSTLLEAVLPAHAAGPVPVEVINPDGLKGSKENAFTYE